MINIYTEWETLKHVVLYYENWSGQNNIYRIPNLKVPLLRISFINEEKDYDDELVKSITEYNNQIIIKNIKDQFLSEQDLDNFCKPWKVFSYELF